MFLLDAATTRCESRVVLVHSDSALPLLSGLSLTVVGCGGADRRIVPLEIERAAAAAVRAVSVECCRDSEREHDVAVVALRVASGSGLESCTTWSLDIDDPTALPRRAAAAPSTVAAWRRAASGAGCERFLLGQDVAQPRRLTCMEAVHPQCRPAALLSFELDAGGGTVAAVDWCADFVASARADATLCATPLAIHAPEADGSAPILTVAQRSTVCTAAAAGVCEPVVLDLRIVVPETGAARSLTGGAEMSGSHVVLLVAEQQQQTSTMHALVFSIASIASAAQSHRHRQLSSCTLQLVASSILQSSSALTRCPGFARLVLRGGACVDALVDDGAVVRLVSSAGADDVVLHEDAGNLRPLRVLSATCSAAEEARIVLLAAPRRGRGAGGDGAAALSVRLRDGSASRIGALPSSARPAGARVLAAGSATAVAACDEQWGVVVSSAAQSLGTAPLLVSHELLRWRPAAADAALRRTPPTRFELLDDGSTAIACNDCECVVLAVDVAARRCTAVAHAVVSAEAAALFHFDSASKTLASLHRGDSAAHPAHAVMRRHARSGSDKADVLLEISPRAVLAFSCQTVTDTLSVVRVVASPSSAAAAAVQLRTYLVDTTTGATLKRVDTDCALPSAADADGNGASAVSSVRFSPSHPWTFVCCGAERDGVAFAALFSCPAPASSGALCPVSAWRGSCALSALRAQFVAPSDVVVLGASGSSTSIAALLSQQRSGGSPLALVASDGSTALAPQEAAALTASACSDADTIIVALGSSAAQRRIGILRASGAGAATGAAGAVLVAMLTAAGTAAPPPPSAPSLETVSQLLMTRFATAPKNDSVAASPAAVALERLLAPAWWFSTTRRRSHSALPSLSLWALMDGAPVNDDDGDEEDKNDHGASDAVTTHLAPSLRLAAACSGSRLFDSLDGAGKCFLLHWAARAVQRSAAPPDGALPDASFCWALISDAQDVLVRLISDFVASDPPPPPHAAVSSKSDDAAVALPLCALPAWTRLRAAVEAERVGAPDPAAHHALSARLVDFVEREVAQTGVGLWARPGTAGTYLRAVADAAVRRIMSRECCGRAIDPRRTVCWLVALHKLSHLSTLCTNCQEPRLAAFFQRDFGGAAAAGPPTPQQQQNRKAALDNAYASLGKGSVSMAMGFFLLADEPEQALRVALARGHFDGCWLLAVLLVRLWSGDSEEVRRMIVRTMTDAQNRALLRAKAASPSRFVGSAREWCDAACLWLGGQHAPAIRSLLLPATAGGGGGGSAFLERLLFVEYALAHSVLLHGGNVVGALRPDELEARCALLAGGVLECSGGGDDVARILCAAQSGGGGGVSLLSALQAQLESSLRRIGDSNAQNAPAPSQPQQQQQKPPAVASFTDGTLNMAAFGNSDDDDDAWMLSAVQYQQTAQSAAPAAAEVQVSEIVDVGALKASCEVWLQLAERCAASTAAAAVYDADVLLAFGHQSQGAASQDSVQSALPAASLVYHGDVRLALATSMRALQSAAAAAAASVSSTEHAAVVWTCLAIDALRCTDFVSLLALLFEQRDGGGGAAELDGKSLLSPRILDVWRSNRALWQHAWDHDEAQSDVGGASSSSAGSPAAAVSATVYAAFALLMFRHWAAERVVPSGAVAALLGAALLRNFAAAEAHAAAALCWRLDPERALFTAAQLQEQEQHGAVSRLLDPAAAALIAAPSAVDLERIGLVLKMACPLDIVAQVGEQLACMATRMSTQAGAPAARNSVVAVRTCASAAAGSASPVFARLLLQRRCCEELSAREVGARFRHHLARGGIHSGDATEELRALRALRLAPALLVRLGWAALDALAIYVAQQQQQREAGADGLRVSAASLMPRAALSDRVGDVAAAADSGACIPCLSARAVAPLSSSASSAGGFLLLSRPAAAAEQAACRNVLLLLEHATLVDGHRVHPLSPPRLLDTLVPTGGGAVAFDATAIVAVSASAAAVTFLVAGLPAPAQDRVLCFVRRPPCGDGERSPLRPAFVLSAAFAAGSGSSGVAIDAASLRVLSSSSEEEDQGVLVVAAARNTSSPAPAVVIWSVPPTTTHGAAAVQTLLLPTTLLRRAAPAFDFAADACGTVMAMCGAQHTQDPALVSALCYRRVGAATSESVASARAASAGNNSGATSGGKHLFALATFIAPLCETRSCNLLALPDHWLGAASISSASSSSVAETSAKAAPPLDSGRQVVIFSWPATGGHRFVAAFNTLNHELWVAVAGLVDVSPVAASLAAGTAATGSASTAALLARTVRCAADAAVVPSLCVHASWCRSVRLALPSPAACIAVAPPVFDSQCLAVCTTTDDVFFYATHDVVPRTGGGVGDAVLLPRILASAPPTGAMCKFTSSSPTTTTTAATIRGGASKSSSAAPVTTTTAARPASFLARQQQDLDDAAEGHKVAVVSWWMRRERHFDHLNFFSGGATAESPVSWSDEQHVVEHLARQIADKHERAVVDFTGSATIATASSSPASSPTRRRIAASTLAFVAGELAASHNVHVAAATHMFAPSQQQSGSSTAAAVASAAASKQEALSVVEKIAAPRAMMRVPALVATSALDANTSVASFISLQ